MRWKIFMLASVVFSITWCDAKVLRAEFPVTFEERAGRLDINIEGRPFAAYIWEDPKIKRPFLAHVHGPNGKQVTRNHPPIAGKDPVDHDTFHPGLWLSFGDLSGNDYWRGTASVRHAGFLQAPESDAGGGRFSVRHQYLTGDKPDKIVCEETCRITIRVLPGVYLIDWRSDFSSDQDFFFGDQEEMGLGVRLATPLIVKNGGKIVNSDGRLNEPQVWGKTAKWCDYSGLIEGEKVGVTLFTDPTNFRPSWFHARDYGLLVANPFGRQAFTREKPSRIDVPRGKTFRLHFGVHIHVGRNDPGSAYRDWLKASADDLSQGAKSSKNQKSEKDKKP